MLCLDGEGNQDHGKALEKGKKEFLDVADKRIKNITGMLISVLVIKIIVK